jgi:hypothetical protein
MKPSSTSTSSGIGDASAAAPVPSGTPFKDGGSGPDAGAGRDATSLDGRAWERALSTIEGLAFVVKELTVALREERQENQRLRRCLAIAGARVEAAREDLPPPGAAAELVTRTPPPPPPPDEAETQVATDDIVRVDTDELKTDVGTGPSL